MRMAARAFARAAHMLEEGSVVHASEQVPTL